MGHEHHHHHHDHKSVGKNIALGVVLNLLFAVIELIGGFITNSVAILTDALHDFGDALSLVVAWVLQKTSEKPRDVRFSYGYKRYSLMGTVFISTILAVGSVIMISESVKRFFHPQEANAQGMFILAVFGIAINGIAALRMKRGKSLSERAIFLHFMEDVLGWIAVLLGSILMIFFRLPWFDPLLSLGIAVWVLYNVVRNLNSVAKIFLQQIPHGIEIEKIHEAMVAVKGVCSVHDLHIWTLDGESHVMTLHAVINPRAKAAKIKLALKEVAHRLSIGHVTIEIEYGEEDCASCDN
ncbi:MAG: Cadmium, cobalt and zinc/H(+)-K(+) antiporter [Turneriella sp.]|nr:Cadmium, cobalt and zinc/H(+)-K(+) antiporter [Turneriella sp.]